VIARFFSTTVLMVIKYPHPYRIRFDDNAVLAEIRRAIEAGESAVAEHSLSSSVWRYLRAVPRVLRDWPAEENRDSG